jgi:hypothetical protein
LHWNDTTTTRLESQQGQINISDMITLVGKSDAAFDRAMNREVFPGGTFQDANAALARGHAAQIEPHTPGLADGFCAAAEANTDSAGAGIFRRAETLG